MAGEELNTLKPNDFRLSAQPIDILEVGKDSGGIVGNHGQNFKLTVAIKSATITLEWGLPLFFDFFLTKYWDPPMSCSGRD